MKYRFYYIKNNIMKYFKDIYSYDLKTAKEEFKKFIKSHYNKDDNIIVKRIEKIDENKSFEVIEDVFENWL